MLVCSYCDCQHTHQATQCRRCGRKAMHYAPSRDEIKKRCATIQRGWSANVEKIKRDVSPYECYEVPHIRHHPRGQHVIRSKRRDG